MGHGRAVQTRRLSAARRWNAWLAERYPDPAALARAWSEAGQTHDPAEDPARGTVALEPLLAHRARYARARQRDFLTFLDELVTAFDQRLRDHCRAQAPTGAGAAVVPYSFDTQYRPGVPWAAMNARGDAVATSMYFWGNGSMLAKPPALYVLDNHRVDGRLGYIYETNRGRPSPYRAEYPYLLGAFAAWQDYDIINWHGIWARGLKAEDFLAGSAAPPVADHFWTAVHQEFDPVMAASMALAGRLFLDGDIDPADDFVRYRLAPDDLSTYDRWHGIGMARDVFARGARLALPGGDDSDRDNEMMPPGGTAASMQEAVRSGPYVTWDWPRERLIVDAPKAKVYVGPTPVSHRFADGLTISGFDTPFVAFALVSADGAPLAGPGGARRMWISAVADAKNTGFDYDYHAGGGPVDQARAVRAPGHAPVVQDPVSVTISFGHHLSGQVSGYDFAMREAERRAVDGAAVRLTRQAWFMNVLSLDARGAATPEVVDPSPGAAAPAAGANAGDDAETVDPLRAAVWCPVPGLG